jgi:leucyl aminopeptidase
MNSGIASLRQSSNAGPDSLDLWIFQSNSVWPAALGAQPDWLKTAWADKRNQHFVDAGGKRQLLVMLEDGTDNASLEKIRKAGAEAVGHLQKSKIKSAFIHAQGLEATEVFAFAEGALLASYRFEKYKSKPTGGIDEIILETGSVSDSEVQRLNILSESVALTRDLVNEPASVLTAPLLSEIFKETGESAGFEVEVLEENKIQALKMGGLLGVNQGSDIPPTFNILQYKSPEAKNAKPIVLVGKGVVYDTGGYSLKTSAGMETMKCDMAGAATVLGVMSAASRMKLPLHIIGLVPATDNRISAAAVSPGDIITISDGTTVEVLNTDAEGRLILADALVFAKRYDPQIVLDFATLTGAAARAIGKEGFVYMGTCAEDVKSQLKKAQEAVYERGVEFPLWDEYAEQIKSPIADLKNIGGAEGGAITAGKFLQHFTSYPWLHFDIAGTAFNEGGASGYIPKGGTGNPVRMVIEWLQRQ